MLTSPSARRRRPGSMPAIFRRPSQIRLITSVPSKSSAPSAGAPPGGRGVTVRSVPATHTRRRAPQSLIGVAPSTPVRRCSSSASSSSLLDASRRKNRRSPPRSPSACFGSPKVVSAGPSSMISQRTAWPEKRGLLRFALFAPSLDLPPDLRRPPRQAKSGKPGGEGECQGDGDGRAAGAASAVQAAAVAGVDTAHRHHARLAPRLAAGVRGGPPTGLEHEGDAAEGATPDDHQVPLRRREGCLGRRTAPVSGGPDLVEFERGGEHVVAVHHPRNHVAAGGGQRQPVARAEGARGELRGEPGRRPDHRHRQGRAELPLAAEGAETRYVPGVASGFVTKLPRHAPDSPSTGSSSARSKGSNEDSKAAPPPSGGSQSVTVAVMAAPARIVDGVRLAVGAVPAAVGTAPPAAIPLIMTATTARFTIPM